MFLVIVTMEAQDYTAMEPRYTKLLSDIVDSNIQMLNTLRMYGAAQDEALGRENKDEQTEFVNRILQKNKLTKSYNLMRFLSGEQPIATWDDANDVQPNTEGLRYFSGSANKAKAKVQAEKVDKAYALMRLMTGGR